MRERDLVAASSTPSVLAVLSDGESYGYAILNRVREVSAGELKWADGMLYPLLHRLHRLGYVTPAWRTAPDGRRRRYYAMRDEGREAMAAHKRQWIAGTRALGGVLPFTLADQASWRSAVIPTDRRRGRAGRCFWHFGRPGTAATPSCRRPRGPDGWDCQRRRRSLIGFTRVRVRRPGATRGVRIAASVVLDQ